MTTDEQIGWATAFVDLPAGSYDSGRDFWRRVSGTRLSPPRDDGRFVTYVPPDGDAYLRCQRVDSGPAHAHLDLHVDDPDALAARAVHLGASVVHREPGLVVLRSPGGQPWCATQHERERIVPAPHAGTRIDQLCLDIPAAGFDRELDFWTTITAWEATPSQDHPEFVRLRPSRAPRPLQLLLQRLDDGPGPNADGASVSAHVDIAAGTSGLTRVEQEHTDLGADVVGRHEWWTVMRGPAGDTYCLTARDPVTGLPA